MFKNKETKTVSIIFEILQWYCKRKYCFLFLFYSKIW